MKIVNDKKQFSNVCLPSSLRTLKRVIWTLHITSDHLETPDLCKRCCSSFKEIFCKFVINLTTKGFKIMLTVISKRLDTFKKKYFLYFKAFICKPFIKPRNL